MKEVRRLLKDIELVTPKSEDVTLSDYKASFYKEVAQANNLTKTFSGNISLSLDDIRELNESICNKFKQYKCEEFLVKVHIKLSNKKELNFSSWRDFSAHEFSYSQGVSNITISWDANIKLPGFNIPQRHRVFVRLSNSMRPEEILKIIFSGELDDIEDLDRNFFPVVARVDFIDVGIGEELLTIIEKWVECLKENPLINQNKFLMNCKKHKRKIAFAIKYTTFILCVWLIVRLLSMHVDRLGFESVGAMSLSQFKKILTAIPGTMVAVLIVKGISNYLAESSFNLLTQYGNGYIFNITRGDSGVCDKIKKEEQFKFVKLVLNYLVSFLISLISGLLIAKL